MVVYGIPVGSDAYVRHMLNNVVGEIVSEVERVDEVLKGESQAMWGVLYSVQLPSTQVRLAADIVLPQ